MQYRSTFPQNKVFTWDDVKFLRKGQYILMHSVIYRTKLLWECRLQLPEHTFHVDNIFVYHPLPYVKTMYYLNVDFYRYYIGREDQSVNEQVMIGRIHQQLKVNYHMIDDYNLSNAQEVPNMKLRHYMRNYLKENDKRTYYWMKWSILGRSMNLPGKSGRKISETAYKLAQKFVGFN